MCTFYVRRDEWGRRQIEIVAIDALCGHRYVDQLYKKDLNRELNKVEYDCVLIFLRL